MRMHWYNTAGNEAAWNNEAYWFVGDGIEAPGFRAQPAGRAPQDGDEVFIIEDQDDALNLPVNSGTDAPVLRLLRVDWSRSIPLADLTGKPFSRNTTILPGGYLNLQTGTPMVWEGRMHATASGRGDVQFDFAGQVWNNFEFTTIVAAQSAVLNNCALTYGGTYTLTSGLSLAGTTTLRGKATNILTLTSGLFTMATGHKFRVEGHVSITNAATRFYLANGVTEAPIVDFAIADGAHLKATEPRAGQTYRFTHVTEDREVAACYTDYTDGNGATGEGLAVVIGQTVDIPASASLTRDLVNAMAVLKPTAGDTVRQLLSGVMNQNNADVMPCLLIETPQGMSNRPCLVEMIGSDTSFRFVPRAAHFNAGLDLSATAFEKKQRIAGMIAMGIPNNWQAPVAWTAVADGREEFYRAPALQTGTVSIVQAHMAPRGKYMLIVNKPHSGGIATVGEVILHLPK